MSRAGFRAVHIARCSTTACDPCVIAEGEADEDRLYRLQLLARCPHCGEGGLEILPGKHKARPERPLRAAIVGV